VQKLGGSYVKNLRTSERNDATIIIPCYNYGQFVSEAIDSALHQTLPPTQIIVINDGSIDNSKEVIDRYKDNPIIKIIHKKNGGVIETKNLGIELSKTYWTVFLDADDKLSVNFLKRTIEMSKNGMKDIVYTDMNLFGAVTDVFKAKPFSFHTLLKTNYINNSALIKTTLLKQIGGYKPEMNHGLEDWELYISLVEIGAKPQYLPRALVSYRQHDKSLSRNQSTLNREKELIGQIKHLHRQSYRKHGYYKTVTLHGLKLLAYAIRYPGIVLVMLKAIPAATKNAAGFIYYKGLTYLHKKLGLID
jgi:O-antigen biosynthesis protein